MITVENVSKFFGTYAALKNISFNVNKGDIFGIVGLSGAGKSTLIRCLATLERPTSGKIYVDDADITRMTGVSLRSFRRKSGMIFQHFNLFSSKTVAENIAYPLKIAGKEDSMRIKELLSLVHLHGKGSAYPAQLSGGEKQRAAIARAIAVQPKILFCDEATSALDPKTTKEILNLLKELNQRLGITIVLITHAMDVIKQICNHVVVLEKGEIVEGGAVSKVFTDPQHSTTKRFLQNRAHDIPEHFFKTRSDRCQLLRLNFKGETASEPIIAHMIKQYDVEANILLGWIDNVQGVMVGTLVIELIGEPEKISSALIYLQNRSVHCEVL